MTTLTPLRTTSALPRGVVRAPYAETVYLALAPNGAATFYLRLDQQVLKVVTDEEHMWAWAEAEDHVLARHLDKLSAAPRPESFAGLSLDKPLIMGVLNVTPDSFSDGGRFLDADAAIAEGRAMAKSGADIIDVGGESTRPGAAETPPEIEAARIVPVVRALAAEGLTVSVDTRHAAVMRAALDAGAAIINDVTALTGDPDSLKLAAESQASIVLMHMQGLPGTMQDDPVYRFAPLDVYDMLSRRIGSCLEAGIEIERLCVDPGIGFGKTVRHNCDILAELPVFASLGAPVLLGVSRKSFIGALSRGEAADCRLPGSLAAAMAGLDRGAQILRVHDVAETAQAVAVWRAINQTGS